MLELKRFSKLTWTIIIALVFSITNDFPWIVSVQADDIKTEVVGKSYQFDGKDSDYNFSTAETFSSTSSGINTYGDFVISGNIVNTYEVNGITAFSVESGDLTFTYSYTDSILNAPDEEWHLIDDSQKKVDDISLSGKLKKGALILQTSNDGKNWVDDQIVTNAFKKQPENNETFYTTKDVQLNNGCYYRFIVAYETRKKVGENKVVFVTTSEYAYRRNVEVYEFYAFSEQAATNADSSTKLKVNNTLTKTKANGYEGSKEIDYNDAHYGWSLGDFFVSGYTESVDSTDGTPVFLKNVGDKVTLWFNLKYDIDKLNSNNDIIIVGDEKGFDHYFQTTKTDFGRGALIIRYTDYQNVSHDPIIYTNYLEANAVTGADTQVQLFEEGDYEVALDYKIQYDKSKLFGQVLPEETYYRMFFKFSVRNGNCMVYPFDVKTGAELSNTALTENGFYIDLAKSRYLKTNVKKEVLNSGASGLAEDTRFNRPAKDGDKYTEEGIYTITVNNEYTGKETTKKIYVGTNPVLKAYVVTGLSLEEINEQLKNGAIITDDGKIIMPEDDNEEQAAASEESIADTPDDSEEGNTNEESSVIADAEEEKEASSIKEDNSSTTETNNTQEHETDAREESDNAVSDKNDTAPNKKPFPVAIPVSVGVIIAGALFILSHIKKGKKK